MRCGLTTAFKKTNVDSSSRVNHAARNFSFPNGKGPFWKRFHGRVKEIYKFMHREAISTRSKGSKGENNNNSKV